jgi:hypothetical protein
MATQFRKGKIYKLTPADQDRHDEIVTLVGKTLRLLGELKEGVERDGVESDRHQ